MRPLGKAEILNMKRKSVKDLRVLTCSLRNCLFWCALLLCCSLAINLITVPGIIILLVRSHGSKTSEDWKPSQVLTPGTRTLEKDSRISEKEKGSARILEISTPVRMEPVGRSGIPASIPIFLMRVSESAQGPLIGRLRSYLDPSRVFCEKKAGESALAYSFSTGFAHGVIPFNIVESNPRSPCGRIPTPARHEIQKTPNHQEVNRRMTPGRIRERRCGWRLMTPASRSTQNSDRILVAEKPTDEALRQGRNPCTQNMKFEGTRREKQNVYSKSRIFWKGALE
jgi:hypothetical protein